MPKEAPIGLLDSGTGGLTIASEVVKQLPGEDIIYYGDHLHLPYGPKDPARVREYALQIMNFLIHEKKVKYLVIACNTATVVALDAAKREFDIPVVGPVQKGAEKAVKVTENGKVGLLATTGTVNSCAYQRALQELTSHLEVTAIAAPRLIPIVESGKITGESTTEAVRRYLEPILRAGCDSVILGCTHFPYLKEIINKVSQDRLNTIYPEIEIAQQIKDELA